MYGIVASSGFGADVTMTSLVSSAPSTRRTISKSKLVPIGLDRIASLTCCGWSTAVPSIETMWSFGSRRPSAGESP
ncbi:unannotated protein [freshwater metagenome]|uniref:Unannotated protein n=1 Tax=freshwater metagenome TaxID=449393 RepID=A0A6J7IVJ2_9ZZZZ